MIKATLPKYLNHERTEALLQSPLNRGHGGADVRRLLGARDAAMMQLLYATGVRASELDPVAYGRF